MCEANWNHVAFLVVLQTTISMELEFNLSQYTPPAHNVYILTMRSQLLKISQLCLSCFLQ